MSDDLRVLLRDCAEAGMTGFTIWRTPNGYDANVQFGRSGGWSTVSNKDPAIAAAAVLDRRQKCIEFIHLRQAAERLARLRWALAMKGTER